MKNWHIHIVLGILALLFYTVFIEPYDLQIKKISLSFEDNNDQLQPLKIVLISDIHRATISDSFLERVVEEINIQQPDIVLIAGDSISYNSVEADHLEPLKNLKPSIGAYAVLGNHDYYFISDERTQETGGNETAEIVKNKFESLGIPVLRNEHVKVRDWDLVGLDDFWANKTDYHKAINGTSKKRIVFAHNPDSVPKAEITNSTLLLFGHTHCGQIRLPLLGSVPRLVGFNWNYEMGLYQINNSYVYTTCGIGGGPRLLAPPEITVIDIT